MLQALISGEKDPKRLGVLRLMQYDHRLFQQAERQAYYSRRMLAVSHPQLYLSLIVDGMQQATCEIPKKFRFEYSGDKLKQKLVGVLVHGDQRYVLTSYPGRKERLFRLALNLMPDVPCSSLAASKCFYIASCLIQRGRPMPPSPVSGGPFLPSSRRAGSLKIKSCSSKWMGDQRMPIRRCCSLRHSYARNGCVRW